MRVPRPKELKAHRLPTSWILCGVLTLAAFGLGACRSTSKTIEPTATRPEALVWPPGLKLRDGVTLTGFHALCCARKLSEPNVVPAIYQGCVISDEDRANRLACYRAGFEAAEAPYGLRVGRDDIAKVLLANGEIPPREHRCRVVLVCPVEATDAGALEPLICEARGPGARCTRDADGRGATCDEAGESYSLRCPDSQNNNDKSIRGRGPDETSAAAD